ncbi:F-box/kelch-repeat protein SKIP11-like [Triticum dicoccoides]|uniref:F-box/kelch-repeat protein SKIP11-like n=1 Tax=Triticum dicoccoides TaxID=85692 RepID=UPI00188F7B51|nr:F-box/kelch-repeat protein SKIP11-like [Triticum dicoccoides]
MSANFGSAAADLEYVSQIGIVHNPPGNPIIDVRLVDSGSHRDKRISSMSLESSSCMHVPGRESGAEAGGEKQDVVSWSDIIGVIGRELFIDCLVRLSRWDYGSIASLNHDFNSVVRNGDIYRQRRKNGVAEHWVYFSCSIMEWHAYDPYRGRWIQVPNMPPLERFLVSHKDSLAVGTELLVFGTEKIVLRYNILTNSWMYPEDGMNTPRCLFGSTSVGEKAYVAGGTDFSGRILSSTEMYDSETHTWRTLPSINRARKLCSGAFMDGKFYVIGGVANNSQLLTCGEEYDLNRQSWRVIDSMSEGLNINGNGAPPLIAVVNNELYAADYRENGLKRYDKLNNEWTSLGNLPAHRPSMNGWGIGFQSCGDRLIFIGGQRTSVGSMVELFSWIPDEQPPVWNLVATRPARHFVYNCAVMGC